MILSFAFTGKMHVMYYWLFWNIPNYYLLFDKNVHNVYLGEKWNNDLHYIKYQLIQGLVCDTSSY